MQREAREHIQRRSAQLQPSDHLKYSSLSCHPVRNRFLSIIGQSRSLASRVSRHRMFHRLLIFSVLIVLSGWVVFFRFIWQQSYVLPGSGDVSISSSPLLLWRDYNPTSVPTSSSSVSSCAASLHPLIGEWIGSCEQLLGNNIIDQPVCSSSPCTQQFAVSYTAGGFVRRYSSGVSSSSSSCSSLVPFTARGDVTIEVSSPLKYMQHAAAKSAWFHGDPYSVTVDQLGCYNAWANATDYQEEGNYDANWRFADFGACPACGTRGALARPGVCTAFGESVVCSPEDGSFSYRCTATKHEAGSGTSVFAGKWHGWCEQKRAVVFAPDGRNLGYVCTTVPYRQEYTVIYDDHVTSFFTGPLLLQSPVPILSQSLSIPASHPSIRNAPLQKFIRSYASVARGFWFSGEPWSITLPNNQGCYEAWANSTHYEEMGNGFNVTGVHASCPACAQNGNVKGKCRSDGGLTCVNNELYSYRCTARRAVPSCHNPIHISDFILERSPSSLSIATVRAIASSTVSSTESFVAGWNTIVVVISPTFLDGLEPFPRSAYPSSASLVSVLSSSPRSPSSSTLKLTSSSNSFGYAVTAEALVAAAGVPLTIDGIPWQYVGVQIDLVVSASRSASGISNVLVKVSRWSPATLLAPDSGGVASGDMGFRGIVLSVTAIVMNKNDAVYYSGILLTLAEGFVLCCLCYVALFVVTFIFYGVRQMSGVHDESSQTGVSVRGQLPEIVDADILQVRHSTVDVKTEGQLVNVETTALLLNKSTAVGDIQRRGEREEAAVAARAPDANDGDSTAPPKTSADLPPVNRQVSTSSPAVVAPSDVQPSLQQSTLNSSSKRVTPQLPRSSSASFLAAAPSLQPVAASTKAAMLSDLDDILSTAVLNVPSPSEGPASSVSAAAMIPNPEGSTPSKSKKAPNAPKAERAKSTIISSFSSDAIASVPTAIPSQAPTAAAKSKINITSKEAVTAAIDLFHASTSTTAPLTSLSPVQNASPLPEMSKVSAANSQEASAVAFRPSNVTSPVPKLDLTKAIQEQAKEMGVNLKEQQKHEAELRRQLQLKPPPPDSDDDDIPNSSIPSSSSSSMTSVTAAGSDMLDKAGLFFKNIKTPVSMFSSEPSLSAAPIPATRVNVSNAPLSVQPKMPVQTSSLDTLLPPPPSNAPGSQDFQRKSMRVPVAADSKSIGASDKVVRPLSFAAVSKQPLEARGAKPDFLTPPPPQAPEPPLPAPPDASLMSSVESVMFKFGSPFTAMFSPAPAAPDRIDADSGKSNVVSEATASVASPAPSVSGGIMDSVTSFGSLFTNAPDRVARLFSPSVPEAPSLKPRPSSPAASDIGSAWDNSSVAGSKISGSASVMSQSLAGGRGSSASVPSAASSQASSSSKSSVARSVVSTAGDAIQWTNLNPKSGLYNLVQQLQLRSYLDEEQAQALKTMIRSSDPLLIGLYQSFEARGFTDFDDFSRPLQRIARRFVESNSKGGEALRPSFSRK